MSISLTDPKAPGLRSAVGGESPKRLAGGAAGAADVALVEVAPMGMLTIKGDLTSGAMASTLAAALGPAARSGPVTPPPARRAVEMGAAAVAWMAPDEVLVMIPREEAAVAAAAAEEASAGAHILVADVSDARALFDLSGPDARDVLAKGVPVDLSKPRFVAGDFRRTRLGPFAAAVWAREARPETLRLFAPRSFAGFVWAWLEDAVAGGPVGGLINGGR